MERKEKKLPTYFWVIQVVSLCFCLVGEDRKEAVNYQLSAVASKVTAKLWLPPQLVFSPLYRRNIRNQVYAITESQWQITTCSSCWCHWSSPIIWRWKTTGAEKRLKNTGSPMLLFTKGWRSEFSCRRKANSSLKPSIGPEIHLWNRVEQPLWWVRRQAFSLSACANK